MCYSHLMHIKHTEPAVLAHPPLTTTEVPLSKTLNTNYLSVQTVITPEIKCLMMFSVLVRPNRRHRPLYVYSKQLITSAMCQCGRDKHG